jgi:hypothetical protein
VSVREVSLAAATYKEETVTRRAKTARFSRRSAATFQSRLPPKGGKRSLRSAPPGCSTVQMHRFEKCLFLKNFFAAVNQWRREWASHPSPDAWEQRDTRASAHHMQLGAMEIEVTLAGAFV